MKHYLSIALALVCIVLVICLVLMKRSDNAQHQSDAGAFADVSNQLDSAQTQIAIDEGKIRVFSNTLDQCQSAASTFSNQLTEARSAAALDAEQITNLTLQIAGMESENQTLSQRVTDLNSQMTNQVAALTGRLVSTKASLDQANKNYALLENRFRIDVAERVVVERKFNNPSELKAQIENLQWSPADVVSADGIYAGLDVEVKSNSFHVISPD